mmetsp:Transcript_23908/g.73649  ORF Transcript_23908/g.73649 Transcript_23908/m.73649 type:complete len:225 (+) Transcript_23908:3945-4619(+)
MRGGASSKTSSTPATGPRSRPTTRCASTSTSPSPTFPSTSAASSSRAPSSAASSAPTTPAPPSPTSPATPTYSTCLKTSRKPTRRRSVRKRSASSSSRAASSATSRYAPPRSSSSVTLAFPQHEADDVPKGQLCLPVVGGVASEATIDLGPEPLQFTVKTAVFPEGITMRAHDQAELDVWLKAIEAAIKSDLKLKSRMIQQKKALIDPWLRDPGSPKSSSAASD